MTPNVRPAAAADADALAGLSTQLGYPMTPGEGRDRLAAIDGHPDHALLVADVDGRVLGWIQVSLTRVFETALQAEIAGLIVDAGARGGSIGSGLLREAEAWARSRGCEAIRVRSNVIRERAHGFYRRAGFDTIKTQHVFEKRLGQVGRGRRRSRPLSRRGGAAQAP